MANSISGPLVISTRAAFFVGGMICATVGVKARRLPTVIVIANFKSSLRMERPPMAVHLKDDARHGAARDPMRPGLDRLVRLASAVQASVLLPYGIGLGLGKGATPQIAA